MILCIALACICLVGSFCAAAMCYISVYSRKRMLALLQSEPPYFWTLHRRLCGDQSDHAFPFCLACARYIYTALFILLYTAAILGSMPLIDLWTHALGGLFFVLSLLAITIVISDIIPRAWGALSSETMLRFAKRPAWFFLTLLTPATILICRFVRLILPQVALTPFSDPNAQLVDLFSGSIENWTEGDKRLLQSVLNFRNRIAREIMRPRVDLFCLSEEITLKQAAELLQREGYSRVPVYRETIDTIVGVLFYKDVLAKYAAAAEAGPAREALLATPVKALVKKVYYCPETKKISSLLQEFRKRQTHMAVVVDEYGGTAGLVTIEDILEEIVGEISDEYDEQEALFTPAPGGGWIVDARMNLLDVEEEMGIKIPQEEDYDTLAGYVFYRVGSIPQAGLVLHHDTFEIEILKSNDRMVEEVRIVPIAGEEPSEE